MWPWVRDLNSLGFIFVGKKISKGLAGSNIPRRDGKWFPNTNLEESKCKSSFLFNDTFEVSASSLFQRKNQCKPICYYLSKLHAQVNQDGKRLTKSREKLFFPSIQPCRTSVGLLSLPLSCIIPYTGITTAGGEQETCPCLFPTFLTVKYSVRLPCSCSGVDHKSPFTVEFEALFSTKDH